MASSDDTRDDYPLSRDYHSIVRLNSQHHLFKEEFGGLLNPQIPLDKDHLKIADVGTGTCIWPIELSRKLPPTASIDAVDISLAQCPPREWLPKNISLIAHNLFVPFPQAMLGKYDVVHVQLFATVIKENNPASVVKNLMGLLKPGGWLQWNDSDINAHSIVSVSEPKADMKSTQDMMALMAKPRNAERDIFNWVAQLGDVFVQQGLEAVQFERFPISDHNKMWVGLNCCMLAEEYCRTLERESSSPDDAARLQSLRETIAGAAAATLQGVAVGLTLVQAVGRKRL